MKEIIKLGMILLIICGVSAVLLGFTNEITKTQIQNQREIESQKKRLEVLSKADNFKLLEKDRLEKITSSNDKIKEVYEGYKDGNLVGYVVKTTPTGFGGAVEVITGIDVDGKITGVRVGSHQETPGLGANATLPSFYSQYDGKSIEKPLSVAKNSPTENQIQAISGATITSDAVTTGVNYAIDAVKSLN